MEMGILTRKTMVILLGSLLAVSLSAAASFAQTDKLVVEDGGGNKVFSVNDAGNTGFNHPAPIYAADVVTNGKQ